MNRWSIYIDIEGFSYFYKANQGKAFQSVGLLINHIYNLGKKVYNGETNSLFVHQLGDGFVIVSLNGAQDINNAIIIAITLMRLLLVNSYMTPAAISIGDFSDVVGCYPKQIQDEYHKEETIRIGHGVLRIFPVTGSSLINSWKLLSSSNSGPLLSLDSELFKFVNIAGLIILESNERITEIDWLNSKINEIEKIGKILEYQEISNNNFLRIRFSDYLKENKLSEKWLKSASKML